MWRCFEHCALVIHEVQFKESKITVCFDDLTNREIHMTSVSSLYQMGNACLQTTSSPCFRVAPQPIEDVNEDPDKAAYCLPWESESKPQAESSRNQPCCFCWCCLCTFTCKIGSKASKKTKCHTVADNLTSSAIDINSILMGEDRVTNERLNQWKSDFESLIRDEAGKKLFQEFLKKEFSDENLLFWVDVEFMKQIQDDAARYITIRKIYREYIQPRANREINVEAWIRKGIEDKLDLASINIFDQAQTQVYLLMYRQSWPRFLASKYYQPLLDIARHDSRVF